MADKSIRYHDAKTHTDIDMKVWDNGDSTYSVATGSGTAGVAQSKPLSNTTPTQLSALSVPCRQLMVMGDPAMTGAYVSIGTSGAGHQIVALAPGQVMFLPVSDVNQLYGLAQTDQDAVIYWPFN